MPKEADSLTRAQDNFYWQQEDWVLHQPVDYETSGFNREIIPITETLIMEKIHHKQHRYGLERRFAKGADGKWELIYYAAPNFVQ